jgi:hypothetical protein
MSNTITNHENENEMIDSDLYEICKNKHLHILSHLEHIIRECEDMDNIISELLPISPSFKREHELLSLNVLKDLYIKDVNHLKQKMKRIQTNIYSHCRHQFVFDTIDLYPEKKKFIKYCEKCELTLDAVYEKK